MSRQTEDGLHEGYVEMELVGPWPGTNALYARFDPTSGSWWTSTWAAGRPSPTGRYRACCDCRAGSSVQPRRWSAPAVAIETSDPDGELSDDQYDSIMDAWTVHARAEDALQRQAVVWVDHVAADIAAGHLAEIDDSLGGVIEMGLARFAAAAVAVFGILIVLSVIHGWSSG